MRAFLPLPMLFVEHLGGKETLQALMPQDGKQDDEPIRTAGLCIDRRDPTEVFRRYFDDLTEYVLLKTGSGKNPHRTRDSIRRKLLHALERGIFTLDFTPTNRLHRAKFKRRTLSPEERVFGVFAEEKVVPASAPLPGSLHRTA